MSMRKWEGGDMATTEDKVWIHETCLAWRGEDPAALLEALMSG